MPKKGSSSGKKKKKGQPRLEDAFLTTPTPSSVRGGRGQPRLGGALLTTATPSSVRGGRGQPRLGGASLTTTAASPLRGGTPSVRGGTPSVRGGTPSVRGATPSVRPGSALLTTSTPSHSMGSSMETPEVAGRSSSLDGLRTVDGMSAPGGGSTHQGQSGDNRSVARGGGSGRDGKGRRGARRTLADQLGSLASPGGGGSGGGGSGGGSGGGPEGEPKGRPEGGPEGGPGGSGEPEIELGLEVIEKPVTMSESVSVSGTTTRGLNNLSERQRQRLLLHPADMSAFELLPGDVAGIHYVDPVSETVGQLVALGRAWPSPKVPRGLLGLSIHVLSSWRAAADPAMLSSSPGSPPVTSPATPRASGTAPTPGLTRGTPMGGTPTTSTTGVRTPTASTQKSVRVKRAPTTPTPSPVYRGKKKQKKPMAVIRSLINDATPVAAGARVHLVGPPEALRWLHDSDDARSDLIHVIRCVLRASFCAIGTTLTAPLGRYECLLRVVSPIGCDPSAPFFSIDGCEELELALAGGTTDTVSVVEPSPGAKLGGVSDDIVDATRSGDAGITRGSPPRGYAEYKGDEGDPPTPSGLSSVGGLRTQKEAIASIARSCLQDCARISRLGVSPPRGVLMHGPPGTGKTLLARSVASELGANLVTLNGSEVLQATVGSSESRLRDIFTRARASAPCVLFVDEIDALCPKSTADGGTPSEVTTRVLGVFIAEVDALGDDCRVFVLAATNRVSALDPSVRRAGRFDREVDIGIPNELDRREILRTLLGKYKHSVSEEDVDLIANRSHGFVGADLESLCRESALHVLQRVRREGGDGSKLSILREDLIAGMSSCHPSALREIQVDVPRVLWDDVGGQDSVKQALKECVEWPLTHPEAFERMGISPPRGVLMYGPPGCGKTMLAKALATEGGMNFISVKGPELFSKFVGESERAVQDVFKKARRAAPCVIFFDEIDAMAASRDGGGDGGSGVGQRVVSQLLQEMDGIATRTKVVVIGATNRPDMIDKAVLRPGRFDRLVYVPPPDSTSLEHLVRLQINRMPHAFDVTPESVAPLLRGCTGAEVVAVFRRAALAALEDSFDAKHIALEYIRAAARDTRRQVTKSMTAFYEGFAPHKLRAA